MSVNRDDLPPDWTTAEGRELLAAIEQKLAGLSGAGGDPCAAWYLVHDMLRAPKNVLSALLCPMNKLPTLLNDNDQALSAIANTRFDKGM